MKAHEVENVLMAYYSKAKIALYAILAGLFVMGGVFVGLHPKKPDDMWVGLVMTFFAALAMISFLRKALNNDVQLIVNDKGIIFRAHGPDLIPWSNIVKVDIAKVKSSKFIRLHLNDQKTHTEDLGWGARLKKILSGKYISISASLLTVSHDDIFSAIEYWRARPQLADDVSSDDVFKNLEF